MKNTDMVTKYCYSVADVHMENEITHKHLVYRFYFVHMYFYKPCLGM